MGKHHKKNKSQRQSAIRQGTPDWAAGWGYERSSSHQAGVVEEYVRKAAIEKGWAKPAVRRDYLYFAYGSNLDLRRFEIRCPDAKPVRRLAFRGWRLVFRGVADVEPCEGEVLHGALYSITDRCEEALDRYEGFRENGAGLYDKVFFRVQGETAMMYRMTRGTYGMPSAHYLSTITTGYADWKLDKRALVEALRLTAELAGVKDESDRRVYKDAEQMGETEREVEARKETRRLELEELLEDRTYGNSEGLL